MENFQCYISYLTDTTFQQGSLHHWQLAPLLVKSNDASRAGPSGAASSLVRSNDASSSWTGSACKYMNTNNDYYEIMVM